MSVYEILIASLKQAGMRITPQRMAICKLLCETNEHPTATRIYTQIREQYPSLSQATVYNTLDTLVGLGIIHTLGFIGDNHVHYDANTTPHINLVCLTCHKITDIASPQIELIENEISQRWGYRLMGARVMYYGLCPTCQSQSRN